MKFFNITKSTFYKVKNKQLKNASYKTEKWNYINFHKIKNKKYQRMKQLLRVSDGLSGEASQTQTII